MSKLEDDMNSQKDYLSQMKTIMQMLTNNRGHGNVVASPYLVYLRHLITQVEMGYKPQE